MFAAFCCWQCDRVGCQPSIRAAEKAARAPAEVRSGGHGGSKREAPTLGRGAGDLGDSWNAQGVLPGLSGLSGFLFCSFFKG